MGKHTEKRLHIWLSWDYQKEEKWLDDQSGQGLHLEKAGPFWSTFTKDKEVRYVYCLDYQPDLRQKEQFREYIEFYQDAGWEHKCSCFGIWHYFRRQWAPHEVQEIYTDRASLKQHYKRIQRVMGIVFLCNLPLFIINTINLLSRLSKDSM